MEAFFRTKLALAKAIGGASRLSGRGGGTSLPGKVLLRMQKDAIGRLAADLPRGSVVISATNGKTTTAALLAEIARQAGITVVHNRAGANMAGGVATSLLEDSVRGRPACEMGLFEVDEAWISQIVDQVDPAVVVLGNLFRDQLDRYGEMDTLAASWNEMARDLPEDAVLAFNVDDPLLAGIAAGRAGALGFGIEERSHAAEHSAHAADSKFCPSCGTPLEYDAVQLGHLGLYRCPRGDFERPHPQISATRIETHGMRGTGLTIATPAGSIEVELPLPGLYNAYNAVAATAAAYALGMSNEEIAAGLEAAKAVFGRVETLKIKGHDVALLLIKNPTGANAVLQTVTEASEPFDVWIGLNDGIADGRDISWIWDVDFELLAEGARRVTCSGTRAEEMALRLAYAGVERGRLTVERSLEGSFDAAVEGAGTTGTPIFALPTYTALLELRTAIARRGDASSHWGKR